MKLLPLVCLLAATAQAAARPVVVELFTSESCSSCPPADAYLLELAQRDTSVLPLAFHVDYWDYLNWRDRFSSPEATARQRSYAAALGSEVYTPQMVVDGSHQVVGSDRNAVQAAIKAARASQASGPDLAIARDGQALKVHVGAGDGAADVLLVGFDPSHTTHVGGGENTGRTLHEANVVRSLRRIGQWRGAAADFAPPGPAGEQAAIIVQQSDGRILAVQRVP